MKIGLVYTARLTDVSSGLYNQQEVGLAKAFARQGHEVVIIRSSDSDEVRTHQLSEGFSIEERFYRSPRIRTHGLLGARALRNLDSDVVISFQDLQLSVPSIYKWCQERDIPFYPYIGTLTSSRPRAHPLSQWALARNLQVYRQCFCLAKTPDMQMELLRKGVKETALMPVGLDLDSLEPRVTTSRAVSRAELGLSAEHKVVGFIGRLEDYKRPLAALDVFAALHARIPSARMVVVGSGVLLPQFEAKLRSLGLSGFVRHLPKLAQKDIWKFYSSCDVVVNLNQKEIFGMSILESLYYHVPVVALRAPGPEVILDHGEDGYLVDGSDENVTDVLHEVLNGRKKLLVSKDKVESRFSWSASLASSGFPWRGPYVA